MGGMHGFGAVDVAAEASGLEGWETRLQAVAFVSRGISRAGIEALDPAEYLASAYHERWLLCAERALVARGKVDESALSAWRERFGGDDAVDVPKRADAELAARAETIVMTTPQLGAATDPSFAVGQQVRVRRMRPEVHHRCPRYLRGAVGTIERVIADDTLPGTRPSADNAEPVYTMCFSSIDLWGDRSDAGEPPYELMIDLWQSYLEAP